MAHYQIQNLQWGLVAPANSKINSIIESYHTAIHLIYAYKEIYFSSLQDAILLNYKVPSTPTSKKEKCTIYCTLQSQKVYSFTATLQPGGHRPTWWDSQASTSTHPLIPQPPYMLKLATGAESDLLPLYIKMQVLNPS